MILHTKNNGNLPVQPVQAASVHGMHGHFRIVTGVQRSAFCRGRNP